MNKSLNWFNATTLCLGFAFLYLPMLILVIFSFSDSKLVTVWGGFSTRWYVALFHNKAYLDGAWVTLRVALISSTIAVVLGTMAAFVAVRYRRFHSRSLFMGMIYAPLILPEVISGLALLLLFIGMGQDRGLMTIIIGHVSFSICFVAIVVVAKLATFDRSLEEAAIDLGSSPFGAFMRVTLPNIASAVVSAWLLAMTLSLDNLVTSSFLTGPTASTLPMAVYSQLRLGLSPQINALSAIVILVVLVGTVAAALISRPRSKTE